MWAVERTLLALALTLAAYGVAVWVRRRTGLALAHPAVTAAAVVFAALPLLQFSVREYQAGNRLLTYLVGPATVAMAVPIHKHRRLVRTHWAALLSGMVAGCLIGVISSVTVAAIMGLSRNMLLSVAPKSVTTPVAFRLSEQLGGIPPLTVAVVQASGVLGAILGPAVLNWLRIRNRLARGLALGAAAHGGGTERALQSSELEGAASSMAMAANALLGTILIPAVTDLLLRLGARLAAPGAP